MTEQAFGKTAVIRFDRDLGASLREDGKDPVHVAPAIRVDVERIARFCLSEDTRLTQDLTVLCGAIWWADRKLTRRRATVWARQIELIVPAYEPERLGANAVTSALTRVLRYLTGDEWIIRFEPREAAPARVQGLPWGGPTPAAVMPFSNGLDSFAQYKLLQAAHPGREIWRVRTKTNNHRKSDETLLNVPVSVLDAAHAEPSYRTRAFVFIAFAALAASASGANRVVIAENGQGSLAPPLMPFANEWPFRPTHPGFIRRLEDLLALILPAPIRFEQPQLWRTKGEVLSLMAKADGAGEWMTTQSCSNNLRHQYGEGGCGFCGGCVLRRTSVCHAGLDTRGDRYAFDVACAALTLTDRYGPRAMRESEGDILRHSMKSMREFSTLVSRSDALSRLQGECMEIEPASPGEAMAKLTRLAEAHARELDAFVNVLPQDAALRRLAA